jgi:serine/threonine protein kinase
MPRTIGKYEILNTLGSGAMGVVYRARDPVIDRIVAIKVLSPSLVENARQRERFYQEARTAGRLRHPNIVVIFDCGENEGVPYIVMEYLEGVDLRDLIGGEINWPLERKLDFIGQICRGLSHAHQKSVIHRDMKPGNMRVLPDGSAKIMDFGIARLSDTSSQTQTGAILGTVAYMAPEQCQSAQVTAGTDIWSVGVVLFELLTGHRPFEADNNIAMIHRIVTDEPTPLSRYFPNCPPELEQIVNRALAKEPADRYQRVDELLADIEKLLLKIRLESPAERPATVPRPQPASSPEPPVEDNSLVVTREVHQAAACIEAGQYQEAEKLLDHLSVTDVDAVIISSLRVTLERHKEQSGVEVAPKPVRGRPPDSAPIVDAEPISAPVPDQVPAAADFVVPEEEPAQFEPPPQPPPAGTISPEPLPVPDRIVRHEPAEKAIELPRRSEVASDLPEPTSPRAGLTEIQPAAAATPAPRVSFETVPPVTWLNRWPLWAILACAVVLAVLGFASYQMFSPRADRHSKLVKTDTGQETVPPATVTQPVSLNVLPWAEILEVTEKSSGRKLPELAGRVTPVHLNLANGEYVFRVRNSAIGRELTFSVAVAPGKPLQFVKRFPEFDPKVAAAEFGIQ